MNDVLRARLIEIAKSKSGLAFYSEIAPSVNLDMSTDFGRAEIGRLLGSISEFEHAANRPLLSVVVISQAENKPGKGFFTLARQLGVYKGANEEAFFLDELAKVRAHWTRDANGRA